MNDAVTGLNLEGFLHLLRADLAAWASLGLIVVIMGLLAWTSWGSRKALRKCLVLSVIVHCGLVLYGQTIPIIRLTLRGDAPKPPRERLRQIQVSRPTPRDGSDLTGSDPRSTGPRSTAFAPWDKPVGGLALPDAKLAGSLAERPTVKPTPIVPGPRPPLVTEAAAPVVESPTPPDPEPTRPDLKDEAAPPPLTTAKTSAEDVPSAVVEPIAGTEKNAKPEARLRPGRGSSSPVAGMGTGASRRTPLPTPRVESSDISSSGPAPLALRSGPPLAGAVGTEMGSASPIGDPEATADVFKTPVEPLPRVSAAEGNVRVQSRPNSSARTTAKPTRRPMPATTTDPLAVARVTPGGVPALPEIHGTTGGRPLADVPEVYRTRLDPNRSAVAVRSGASPASEQAVERALDWLARHQDADGRWDAATAKYEDGTAMKGDDDFTVHCPAGETCFGECIYWEADTALTGLSLLAYLGAGYTHTDGKYAQTVGKGLDFLLAVQRPDGDLRGRSRAVGMYCHAMASIALCEAYALTGDEKLRKPVERAIEFLVKARAADGMAWRYSPGEPYGDTSILGWVVMAFKSAREVGIAVPSDIQTGISNWLDKVADGEHGGLARYTVGKRVKPTMTAEAWVCRQFLGVGGPGASSTEAAASLLENRTDEGTYNFYYWYYGTLAMYQHGGDAWSRWNARVRDEIVRRQHVRGHIAGSWDPDDSQYGTRGGRVYCTALATLSLEVYYRYLRLYDEPRIPPAVAPGRTRTLGRRDAEPTPVTPSR
jgi:hypothetical protein